MIDTLKHIFSHIREGQNTKAFCEAANVVLNEANEHVDFIKQMITIDGAESNYLDELALLFDLKRNQDEPDGDFRLRLKLHVLSLNSSGTYDDIVYAIRNLASISEIDGDKININISDVDIDNNEIYPAVNAELKRDWVLDVTTNTYSWKPWYDVITYYSSPLIANGYYSNDESGLSPVRSGIVHISISNALRSFPIELFKNSLAAGIVAYLTLSTDIDEDMFIGDSVVVRYSLGLGFRASLSLTGDTI